MDVRLEDLEYQYLKKSDEKLSLLIEKWGKLVINTPENLFEFIIREIIKQMLSIKYSIYIFDRFKKMVGDITPFNISKLTIEEIKSIGASTKKAEYIKGFSDDALNNRFNISDISTLNDEELIKKLTSIKGIGIWTAEMVACFGLGRKDIWSYDDIALKNGIMKVNPQFKILFKNRFYKIGNKYRPLKSFAALYFYQENDN